MMNRFLTRNEQFALIAAAGAVCLGVFVLMTVHPDKASRVSTVHPPLTEHAKKNYVSPLSSPSSKHELSPQPAVLSDDKKANDHEASEYFTEKNKPIRVAVIGWVRKPGTYSFSQGERVEDAIAKAGGLRDGANVRYINLVAPLLDGTTLIIPRGTIAQIKDDKLLVRGSDSIWNYNPPQYTLPGWTSSESASANKESETYHKNSSTQKGLVNINTATEEELISLPGIGPVLAQRIIESRSAQPFKRVEDLIRVKGIGQKRLESLRPFITVDSDK